MESQIETAADIENGVKSVAGKIPDGCESHQEAHRERDSVCSGVNIEHELLFGDVESFRASTQPL